MATAVAAPQLAISAKFYASSSPGWLDDFLELAKSTWWVKSATLYLEMDRLDIIACLIMALIVRGPLSMQKYD